MINGFEQETEPLNDYEQSLLPIFIQGLKTKLGKESAVTNDAMISGLEKMGHKLNQARVRKIIAHIRNKQLIKGLMASSKGYYITNNPEEIKEYIESLQGRIEAILAIKRTFENYLTEITSSTGKLF